MKDDKHKLAWRNCCDLSHAWTGLVRLNPGQAEPYHKHTTPMFYYILQVSRDSDSGTAQPGFTGSPHHHTQWNQE